ncbi:hypothetical protein [Flavobacterium sp.]|uniref:hypothetical protein n=1 Tax=Flavobacterium sp. TaxID=239 RepID=UPI0031DEF4DE
MISSDFENTISKNKNILLVLEENKSREAQYLIDNFCGTVVNSFSDIQLPIEGKKIYAFGNINKLENNTEVIFVIKAFG